MTDTLLFEEAYLIWSLGGENGVPLVTDFCQKWSVMPFLVSIFSNLNNDFWNSRQRVLHKCSWVETSCQAQFLWVWAGAGTLPWACVNRGTEGFPDAFLHLSLLPHSSAGFLLQRSREWGGSLWTNYTWCSKGHPVSIVHLKGQLTTTEDKFPGGKYHANYKVLSGLMSW